MYNKETLECSLIPEVFDLNFTVDKDKDKFVLNYSQVETVVDNYKKKFGKSILVTNNLTFTPEKVLQLYFNHYIVEKEFKQFKDRGSCFIDPIFHRKDMTIKAHIFCCIVGFCFLRTLEWLLDKSWIKESVKNVMEDMHRVLSHKIDMTLPTLKHTEVFKLSKITGKQSEIFSLFNYKVVLGKLNHK